MTIVTRKKNTPPPPPPLPDTINVEMSLEVASGLLTLLDSGISMTILQDLNLGQLSTGLARAGISIRRDFRFNRIASKNSW